jgi:hypothetical protein
MGRRQSVRTKKEGNDPHQTPSNSTQLNYNFHMISEVTTCKPYHKSPFFDPNHPVKVHLKESGISINSNSAFMKMRLKLIVE